LEWCKLFTDRNAPQGWRKVFEDQDDFEELLMASVGLSTTDWTDLVRGTVQYRNKFVAHLDDLSRMDIPNFDAHYRAVTFYHGQIVATAVPDDLAGLPIDLEGYRHQHANEARRVYSSLSR